MTTKQFRWTFVAALIVAVAWVFFTLPAGAEWPRDAFSCKSYRADLAWKYWAEEHCGRRWRRDYGYYKPSPDSDVMKAQIRLQQLGYELDADGFTGPETKEALQRFQHESGLPVTGDLDRITKYTLYDDGPSTAKKKAWDRELWSRRPTLCQDKRGQECTCDPIVVFTGEHVTKDAKGEALRRWRGHVRALLGETWMDWSKAPDPKILECWETGTGERAAGDKTGHTRCVAQARACFGPQLPYRDED